MDAIHTRRILRRGAGEVPGRARHPSRALARQLTRAPSGGSVEFGRGAGVCFVFVFCTLKPPAAPSRCPAAVTDARGVLHWLQRVRLAQLVFMHVPQFQSSASAPGLPPPRPPPRPPNPPVLYRGTGAQKGKGATWFGGEANANARLTPTSNTRRDGKSGQALSERRVLTGLRSRAS